MLASESQNEIVFSVVNPVHVISQKPLREFERKHADAGVALRAWLKLTRSGRFRNFAELKQTFRAVDLVRIDDRDFYVFNIRGNNYRLVTTIHFNTQRLFIRHVLTHAEYSAERWKR